MMTALYAWGLVAGGQGYWQDFYQSYYIAGASSRLYQAMEAALANPVLVAQWRKALEFHLEYEALALEGLGRYAVLRGFDSLIKLLDWGQTHIQQGGELVEK